MADEGLREPMQKQEITDQDVREILARIDPSGKTFSGIERIRALFSLPNLASAIAQAENITNDMVKKQMRSRDNCLSYTDRDAGFVRFRIPID